MSSVDKIITCQVSYMPMKAENIKEKVEKVLDIIKNSGLEYKIGLFATEIKGSDIKIFSLIKDIYDAAKTEDLFILDIKISNVCGC